MNSPTDLASHQYAWANEYRKELANNGVNFIDAEAESAQQLELLRTQNIDPTVPEEWTSVEEAVAEYIKRNPLPKAQPEHHGVWDFTAVCGYYIMIASLWLPISDAIQGKWEWYRDITPRFFLAIPFVICLLATFILGSIVYQRHGVAKAIVTMPIPIAVTVSVLFGPDAIWGDALKTSYGKIPSLLVMAIIFALGFGVRRFATWQSDRSRKKTLIQAWEYRKTNNVDAINAAWFVELELTLRNGYHYTSKMIRNTLKELQDHLQVSDSHVAALSAEEEFGPVSDFAYDLARNNHHALVRTRLYELVSSLFGLTVGIVAAVIGIENLITEGHTLASWLIALFGLPLVALFITSSFFNFREWLETRKHREDM